MVIAKSEAKSPTVGTPTLGYGEKSVARIQNNLKDYIVKANNRKHNDPLHCNGFRFKVCNDLIQNLGLRLSCLLC
jgi:hypothetical protein